jgi:hypothetical protein
MKKALVIITLAATLALASLASAAPSKGPKRQKALDFEDATVEAMNRRPLDSFNQISEKDRKRKAAHLYKKRSGFGSETAETIQQMRYN